MLPRFVKVYPRDYRRVIEQMEKEEAEIKKDPRECLMDLINPFSRSFGE